MADVELQENINKKIFFIIISNRKVRLHQTQLGDSQREFDFGHTVYDQFEHVRGHFGCTDTTYWLKINWKIIEEICE